MATSKSKVWLFTAESDNGTISSNTLARTDWTFSSISNDDSSSSYNIWYGKFISFQSNFTDSFFQVRELSKVFFSRVENFY